MKTTRNYGIDCLRILSMLMVCTLHILSTGGILTNTLQFSPQYEIAWLLETAAFCAVNCYALISGYVGVFSSFKLSNLLILWLQVTFYSFGFYVLSFLLTGTLEPLSVYVHSLFPVTSVSYWYFTAYFCAFFLFPAINWLVQNMPKEKMQWTIGSCVFLFSIIPTFRNGYLFGLENGYSTIWIIVLYLFGCYIRKNTCFSNWSIGRLLGTYTVCVVFGWAWRWLMEIVGSDRTDMFCKYISFNILAAATVLLVSFSKMQFSTILQKIIGFFAPLSFGVYIIHLHPVILNHFIQGRFTGLSSLPAPVLLITVPLTAIYLFLCCAAIDYLRLTLFKIFRIKEVSISLSTFLTALFHKLGKNFTNFK